MIVDSFFADGVAYAIVQKLQGNGTTYVVAVPALQNSGKADGGSFVGVYFKLVEGDYIRCNMTDWPTIKNSSGVQE